MAFFVRIFAVLLIFGGALAYLWYGKMLPGRKLAQCVYETHVLVVALEKYLNDYGELPEGGEPALPAALMGANLEEKDYLEHWSDQQKGLEEGTILDAYGNPYRIRLSGQLIRLRSAGPNGKFEADSGGGDDVTDHSYGLIIKGEDYREPPESYQKGVSGGSG